MGLNPQQAAQLQQIRSVTKDIRGELKVNSRAGVVRLELRTEGEEAKAMLPSLTDQLANQLVQSLSTFFAIKGEIIETEAKI